jgi:hypothetical protein
MVFVSVQRLPPEMSAVVKTPVEGFKLASRLKVQVPLFFNSLFEETSKPCFWK